MIPFHQLIPGIGLHETRSVTLFGGEFALPADSYGFLELYCVEPRCDCRRVMINVLSERRRSQVATINHAFEPPGAKEPVAEQTFLDPLNPQSDLSAALLDLFQRTLLFDPSYGQRFERHYRMVKDALLDSRHSIHDVIRSAVLPG